MEAMTVRLEILPLGCDDVGVWLVPGGEPLRPPLPVAADHGPDADMRLELATRQLTPTFYDSPSWRVDGPVLLVTYVVLVYSPTRWIKETWSQAAPISPELLSLVASPGRDGPLDEPVPSSLAVIAHALRHLKLMIDNDLVAARQIPVEWHTHLEGLRPALAGIWRPPLSS